MKPSRRLRGRAGALLGELLVVILGVLLAIAADRWNQGRIDRATEQTYLRELEGDLRRDTAALSTEIARAERREASARLILGVVIGGEPMGDPATFVDAVMSASTYGEPVQARETFDDLAQTGRLGLITDGELRRLLSEYYQFIERRSQSYDLQRQRVWGDYLPYSVAALPLRLQEWEYGVTGRLETDEPAPTGAEAEAVARALRESEGLETALKGVVRATWSLVDNWTLMRLRAEELLRRLEEERGP